MEKGKWTEYPVNSIRICLDTADGEDYSGRIYGIALEKEIVFGNANDFIIKVDEAFNRIGQPQSGQALRKFKKESRNIPYIGNPERYHGSRDISEMKGMEKTVDLVMTSRQRAEWQGMMMDSGGGAIGSFVSVLECLQLLSRYKG